MSNTPQLTGAFAQAASRRLAAAFAQLSAVGLHHPLALALGRQGESAWTLALGLLAQLPKGALLLADRLYGCAAALVARRWWRRRGPRRRTAATTRCRCSKSAS